jgi:regulator of protease activity HflC (stomatin/prohibitin superfamily)
MVEEIKRGILNIFVENPVLIIPAIIIIIVLGILSIGFFTSAVPAGHIGIQDTFGAVSDQTLQAGFYVKAPWTAIVPMTIQTQKYAVSATAASSDLQDVSTEVTVNFHLNGLTIKDIYKNIGSHYSDIVIVPAVQESVKASTALFNASELITERPIVKEKIEKVLTERLAIYNIVVESVSITNFTFSPEFTQSIETKMVAQQSAFKAENDLVRIKIEKEQAITQAEAIAAATKIKADADAYALRVVNEELKQSQSLLQYKSIEKWNGVLPLYSGQATPFIDITKAGG